ncbi:MAG: hypothetical protein ACOH5I_17155 [Oligoflexus sp.]
MLKFVILNRKKVPVPVPLKTLQDLISWIEDHLVRKDHTITRIRLDHEDIDFSGQNHILVPAIKLKSDSLVECQIDTPLDIGVQTLDALRNLCMVLERSLKPIAVQCWQIGVNDKPIDLRPLIGDLELIDALLDHLLLIIDVRVDSSNARAFRENLEQGRLALQYAIEISDWKAVARILLKQVEISIADLNQELGFMQKCVFELIADHNYCPSEAFLGGASQQK